MTENEVKLAGDRVGVFSGAVEAMQALAEERTTARDLLEGCLEAIGQDNGKVNAVVLLNVEDARRLADSRDSALRAGRKTGPLHGLPVTIKECFDVEGMPTTWGDPALAPAYPARSAGVARRMAEAGAVLIGKTNLPARLGDWETDNPLFGGTRNPHDLSRSAGGSSGGSAAAVACGFSYADVGSDQGGSIRLPAHYCGVNGLKPTWGILPMSGHSMLGETRVPDIGVSGPFARKAEDLSVLIDVLAGSEEPGTAWRLQLSRSRIAGLKGLRIGVMLEHEECPVDAAYLDALNRFLGKLEAAGAQVDRAARPGIDFNDANNLMNSLVRAETSTRLDEEQFLKALKAAESDGIGIGRFKYINAKGSTMPHRRWLQLHEKRMRICDAWRNFFNRYDFFLCPVSASAAAPFRKAIHPEVRTIPVNGEELPVLTQHFWFSFASLAYLPSNAAPIGTTSEGLPCGVQVIGRKYGDHDVAAVSALLSNLIQV
ncbi:MAG: amidase family protein [Albidovulum sp.]|nr:amidase family protein [Albidovulum sp.]